MGHECSLGDHGTWKGSWSLLRRINLERWELQQTLRRHNLEPVSGLMLPTGEFLVEAATSRQALPGNKISGGERKAFQSTADRRWNLWLQRHAVEVLPLEDSCRLVGP